jgi:hypothetical protein
MPDEELFELDVPVVEQQRNRGHGQVQRLHGRLKINEAVAPRNFEEAIAQGIG